ncbi:hypothetical protein DVH24_007679 [Malus domestica]|uniref:Uncharacterized protein n=1 Tax=Malus domestica TaxID=3750 RepID=A0A498HND3_MALDO|nr:hypothetical protein DVH24_007679 [Malus domestica]
MRVLLVKADDSTRHIIVVLLRNVATKAKLNRHHMCRSRIKGWFANGVFTAYSFSDSKRIKSKAIDVHIRVFDEDNTIIAPYSLTLWDPFSDLISLSSVTRLVIFGSAHLKILVVFVVGYVVILVSWLGLYEYKHDGSKARELEEAIGIKVIRHAKCDVAAKEI